MRMHSFASRAGRGLLILLGVAACAALTPAQPKTAAKPAEKIEVKSTLENLQVAFNGESNAHARYVAFAKKADEEGYGKVASLFRAAAKAEEIHANNHARVIKKMGGTPKAEIKTPEPKTTKENLEAAIAGETYEFKVMYPAFMKKARRERNSAAIRTINYATKAEIDHAKLYGSALKNLEAWKSPNQNFYVCSVCGNTVEMTNFKKCPVCSTPKEAYEAIK